MKYVYSLGFFCLFFIANGQAPSNDACTNAIAVAPGNVIAGTTVNATSDASIAPNCGSNIVNDGSRGVWYSLAGTGQKITLSTCSNADYDTSIGVYSGSCGSLTCIAGNDDGNGCNFFSSKVSFNSLAGTTYFILVDGYKNETGSFNLTVTGETAPTPPSNDQCAGATALNVFLPGNGTRTNANNTNATNFSGFVDCDKYSNINDVWFSFNSGANTEVNVEINLTDTDGSGPLKAAGFVKYEVYEGCGGSPLNHCGEYDKPKAIPVNPSTDYFIQAWNSEISAGAFTIRLNGNSTNTAPTVNDDNATVDRLAINGTEVVTVSVNDAEGNDQLFSITGGNTEGIFTIGTETGIITILDQQTLRDSPNASFTLTVRADDQGAGSLFGTGTITVQIEDNQAPEVQPGQTLALAENSTELSYTIIASDPDGDNLTYEITSGNTGSAFGIINTNQLSIANAAALDFETNPAFTLGIRVTDDGSGNLSDTDFISINLTNVNESPVVSGGSATITQNHSSGVTLDALNFADPDADQAHTYAITDGNNSGIFSIDANTGQVSVANGQALSQAGEVTHALTIEVTDNGSPTASGTGTYSIAVVNNNPPTISTATLDVFENSENGTLIGTISAQDSEGDQMVFDLIAGNELGAFSLAASGELRVANHAILDHENRMAITLSIQAQDDGVGNLKSTSDVTINIVDVNEAPTVANTSWNISRDSYNGQVIGTVGASDPEDDYLIFTIQSGNGSGVFSIDANTGVLSILDNTNLAPSSYTLSIQASDSKLTSSGTVIVNVLDADAPTLEETSFTIAENPANGTVIATLYSNDEDGLIDYKIISGNSSGAFALDPTTGKLSVNNAALFDAESTQQFSLQVQITEGSSNQFKSIQQILISLTDMNEFAPSLNTLTTQYIDEEASLSYTVSATDQDLTATFSYSIDAQSQSLGMSIDANTGELTWTPTEAQNGTYQVEVTVSDGSLTDASSLTIVVNELNTTPVIESIANMVVNEFDEVRCAIHASDKDNDELTYSLDATSLADGLTIDLTTLELVWTPGEDDDGLHNVTITVSDGTLSTSHTFSIQVNELNSTPDISVIDNREVDEFKTLQFNIEATDADGDALTYDLNNEAKAAGMQLDETTGAFTWTPSGTQAGRYEVTVSASDYGLTGTASFVITVMPIDQKIYPNPVKDVLSIEASGVTTIQIISMTGDVMMNLPYHQKIDLSALPSNHMYIIRFLDENGKTTYSERFAKAE